MVSLVVASQFDPFSILQKLLPYLAGSANIVVHSPYVQVGWSRSRTTRPLTSPPQIVTDLQNQLRELPQYLGPAVTEMWLRRYQVLPGRTHPMMNMSGSGGFILHTIRMYAPLRTLVPPHSRVSSRYDDPTAQSIVAHRQKKKAKLDADTAGSSRQDSVMSETSTPGKVDVIVSSSSSPGVAQPDSSADAVTRTS